MVDHFIKHYESIVEKIKKPSKRIQISIYNSATYNLNYSHLIHLLEIVFNELKN